MIYGLYMLPIIRADRAFKDDVPRMLYNCGGWSDGDGRPLTEWLITWLSGGKNVVDMSPLPHVLAVLLMAYCVTVYTSAYFFDEDKEIGAGTMMATSLVFFSPFLLENFSYQLDVISHVVAICATFFVFVFRKNDNRRVDVLYLLAVVLMGLASLCTYQTAIGMIVGLCFLDILIRVLQDKKPDWILQAHRVAGCGIAVVIYRFVIIPAVGAVMPVSTSEEGVITQYIQAYGRVYLRLDEYLRDIPRLLVITTFLVVVVFDVMAVVKLVRADKSVMAKVITAIYVIVTPGLIFVTSFAPVVVSGTGMSNRVLVAYVACMAYLSYTAMYIFNQTNITRYLAILIVPFFCLAFIYMYVYGTAEKNQAEYDRYIAYNLVHDLDEVNADDTYTSLTIIGNPGYSPYLNQLPFAYNDIFTNFWSTDWMGGEYIWGYTRHVLEYSDAEIDQDKLVKVKGTGLYNIYTIEDEARIAILFRY